jgi:Chromo (CHRromatin Organisation MOdifier) domain
MFGYVFSPATKPDGGEEGQEEQPIVSAAAAAAAPEPESAPVLPPVEPASGVASEKQLSELFGEDGQYHLNVDDTKKKDGTSSNEQKQPGTNKTEATESSDVSPVAAKKAAILTPRRSGRVRKSVPVLATTNMTALRSAAPRGKRARKPKPQKKEPKFEVAKIVDSKDWGRSRTKLFRVHWKGYTSEDDTWEPLENLDGCSKILQAFLRSR